MKKLFVFLVVLAITSSFISGVLALAVDNVYSNDFEGNVTTGWYEPWGGDISIANGTAYSGSKSLKISDRVNSWDSPSINFYNYIKDTGPGVYQLSAYIMADSLSDDDNDNYTRLILRGNEGTSFMNAYGSNYYCAVTPAAKLTEGQWRHFSGTFTVASRDIVDNTGLMYLCIDLLAPEEAQSVYFDNVTLVRTVPHHTALSIIPAEMILDIGQSKQLTANISSGVSYASSDTSIATVNSSGRVTGKAPGRVTITASYGDERSFCTVWVKSVPDGTYFVKNENSQKYLKNNNSSPTVSAFSSDNNQKWCITYEGSLQYSIVSLQGDKALTVIHNEYTDEVSGISLVDFTGAYEQCWEFEIFNDVEKLIIPMLNRRIDPDLYLAVDNNMLSLSNNIENAKKRWVVCPTRSLIVLNYYDQGFLKRLGNSVELIKNSTQVASNRFKSIYNLNIVNFYIPCESTVDICKKNTYGEVNRTTVDSPCTCGNSCTLLSNVHESIKHRIGNGDTITAIVFWTGHVLYEANGAESMSKHFKSSDIVVLNLGGIKQLENNPSSVVEDKRVKYSYTWLHELSHRLGCVDHYCYKKHNLMNPEIGPDGTIKCINEACDQCYFNRAQIRKCIMGDNDNTLESYSNSALYCGDCRSNINEKLASYS